MPPVAYTGALQPKKKSELQEIAVALHLSDQGTKDELQNRIKRHLDNNQLALEEDPVFAGLFGRRKRSVQPQSAPSAPPPSTRFAPPVVDAAPEKRHRRITPMDPVLEATPTKDLHDVSTFLKDPFSPADSSPAAPVDTFGTPSSLPPLPPSPSPAKSIMEHLRKPQEVLEIVNVKPQEVLQSGNDMLVSLRSFLSNGINIWSLTALIEFITILSKILIWKSVDVPLSWKGSASSPTLSVPYIAPSVFQTTAFWATLLHWAVPSLLIPATAGTLITFNPTKTTASGIAPFDPLTASIVRVAAQVAYPYPRLNESYIGVDVLGFTWRVVGASLGLAFAFSEAIAGAPRRFASTLIKDRRQRITLEEDDSTPSASRRALTVDGEVE